MCGISIIQKFKKMLNYAVFLPVHSESLLLFFCVRLASFFTPYTPKKQNATALYIRDVKRAYGCTVRAIYTTRTPVYKYGFRPVRYGTQPFRVRTPVQNP